jgi:dihydroflavonol-4-reductase
MPLAPILITGGLGFLGSHVASRFSAAGEAVRIFARPERRASVNGTPHQMAWGDIRDAAAVERAVEGCQVVIHLASNFRRASTDRDAHAINVDGTRNVVEACKKAGVRQLIHGSTIGVHGSVKEVPASEESAFSPSDVYQETKLLAEEEVWRGHRDGLPVTVIRPISLFGPGDERMLKLFRLVQSGRFVMLGDGSTLFQPAYVDDVVEVFRLALRRPEALGEVFIAGGEEYMPLNDLVRQVAEELGVGPPRLRLPLAPIKALAALCEAACAPFGIEPPLHRRRVGFFDHDRAFSIDKARRVLGFQPSIPLREGLRRTIGWYREQGWL